MRRIFVIGLIILALLLVGIALYFVLFRDSGLSADNPDPNFGTSGDYEPGNGSVQVDIGQVGDDVGQEVAPRLIKITDGPVAYGTVVLSIPSVFEPEEVGSTTPSEDPPQTIVRYIERASGNVYDYDFNERTLTRISNRTLPGIVEASWTADGAIGFLRFLENSAASDGKIQTYALPIDGGEGSGYFLEPGLSEVAIRGTSSMLTLLPSTNGSIGTLADPDGSDVKTLFSSPLSSLRLNPSGDDFVAFMKASAEVGGYAFFIDGASGAFERFAGPLRGLTALGSPDGAVIFYSYLSGNSFRSELLDVETRIATSIPLGTLPEKCVFSSDSATLYCAVPRALSGSLPDEWYQGSVSFSDRLWKIDLESRVAVLLIDPTSAAEVTIDAVSLSIDVENDVLVFVNRIDGSLWAYDL